MHLALDGTRKKRGEFLIELYYRRRVVTEFSRITENMTTVVVRKECASQAYGVSAILISNSANSLPTTTTFLDAWTVSNGFSNLVY